MTLRKLEALGKFTPVGLVTGKLLDDSESLDSIVHRSLHQEDGPPVPQPTALQDHVYWWTWPVEIAVGAGVVVASSVLYYRPAAEWLQMLHIAGAVSCAFSVVFVLVTALAVVFGPEFARWAVYVQPSVEAAPPGDAEFFQLSAENEATVAVAKSSLGASMMHSTTYRNSRVSERVIRFIEESTIGVNTRFQREPAQ